MKLDTPLRSRITEEIREVLRQMTGFYRGCRHCIHSLETPVYVLCSQRLGA